MILTSDCVVCHWLNNVFNMRYCCISIFSERSILFTLSVFLMHWVFVSLTGDNFMYHIPPKKKICVTFLGWIYFFGTLLCFLGDAFMSLTLDRSITLVNLKLTSHQKWEEMLMIWSIPCPVIYNWRCYLEWMTGQEFLRPGDAFMKTLPCSSSLINLTGKDLCWLRACSFPEASTNWVHMVIC